MSVTVLYNSEDSGSHSHNHGSLQVLSSSSAMIHEALWKGVWYRCPIYAKLSTDTYSHVYFQTTCLQVHRVFHLFYFVSCVFYYSFYFVQCVFQCKDLFDYTITSLSLIKCIFKGFIESPESRQF